MVAVFRVCPAPLELQFIRTQPGHCLHLHFLVYEHGEAGQIEPNSPSGQPPPGAAGMWMGSHQGQKGFLRWPVFPASGVKGVICPGPEEMKTGATGRCTAEKELAEWRSCSPPSWEASRAGRPGCSSACLQPVSRDDGQAGNCVSHRGTPGLAGRVSQIAREGPVSSGHEVKGTACVSLLLIPES